MRPFPRAFSSGQTRLDRKKGSLEIDIQDLVPIGLTHLEEFRSRKNPGVATEDVDPAVAFDRSLSHAAIVFHLGNVRGHGARNSPVVADFGGCCFGLGQDPSRQ